MKYFRLLICAFLVCTGAASKAVVFTNLYSFTGGSDGQWPMAPLIQGQDGKLYSTTDYGGFATFIYGYGTVYSMTLDGQFNSIYVFQNNGDPERPAFSGLVQDQDGYLYGTTQVGGDYSDGTVFTTDTDGDLFPIYSFSAFGGDGVGPQGGLTMTPDGSLFGTTVDGGNNSLGTVFELDYFWDYSKRFSFNGFNGANPYGRLVLARDGQLYGTTFAGGTFYHGKDANGISTGYGTVFRISTNGVFAPVFSFNGTNGTGPIAGLAQGRDGALYGTTQTGGTYGYGTVYKITTNGEFTSLLSFDGASMGGYPVGGLVQGADGYFYGTTADLQYLDGNSSPSVGNGSIFRITPMGSYTKLHSFTGGPGGIEPLAGLIQASDGNFYGTCFAGGNGLGMIYRLSVPKSPVLQAPQSSPAGITLNWSVVPGESYQLQYESSLLPGGWANMGSALKATNTTMSELDPAPAAGARFYRVMLLP
ncbi:MAG TPA: choice-of-anchor tandem repeat GloVer-containing protein [Verrucomicrobiae bacterium]|nr:choice-of-anchor tandem repeat GloVer-containing protein [Verrucomicrobiae bacterium]